MGLTSAMVTGLSGLSANQSKIDAIGNNISNVNTLGYKSSRVDFKTQFSITSSTGSSPDGVLGGTNPMQVGLGTVQASTTTNFSDGSREVTGVNSNLAIEGDGFFVLQGGSRVYTRDGSFKLNSSHQLVSSDGMYVQGYGIDSNFNIIPGVLSNISIPLGELTVAEATENVKYAGKFNTDGTVASSVSTNTSSTLMTDSSTGLAATGTSLLANIEDSVSSDSMFSVGSTLTLSASKGSSNTDTKTLTITGTTTVNDLLSFMNGSLGINTSTGVNGTADAPGVTLTATGAIEIVGNLGTENDITMKNASIKVTDSSGTATNPFQWAKTGTTTGESVSTSTTVYDSLGSACTVNITMVLINKSDTGTQWRYFATSPDGTGTNAATNNVLGDGVLSFDTNGKLLTNSQGTITIDRTNTGATPALTFDLDFSSCQALSGTTSTIASTYQDGSMQGTLTDYSVGDDGIISGTFSNGLVRNLGQVALATFSNNQGLVDVGNNCWVEGPNSGSAIISAPGEFSAGSIIGGSLELSNVDLSAEFINLITASTGFSAASRVITTTNQLMQELLSSAR